jgi:hypothetical protein
METTDITRSASILSVAAVEAAEEPDAIMRNPEVVDVLEEMADHADLRDLFARVIPGVDDPAEFLRALAHELAPFRSQPLDDDVAPEIVVRLAVVARVFQIADSLESVSESAALAFA